MGDLINNAPFFYNSPPALPSPLLHLWEDTENKEVYQQSFG